MLDLAIQNLNIKGFKIKNILFGNEGTHSTLIYPEIYVFTEERLNPLKLITLKNVLFNLDIEKLKNVKFKKSSTLEILKLISSNFKLETVLKLTEDALRELLNSDGASILLYNEDKNVLNFYITSGGASGSIETIDIPINASIAGECFKKKETLIINDAQKNPLHFKQTDLKAKYKTTNLIATPLFFENNPIGVLEAVNKKDNYYTEEDKYIIELFSSLISNKLMNSKIYNDLSSTVKGFILAVATAIDLRDNYTHTHSKNVSNLAIKIGKILKFNDSFLEELEIAALLHDIGKIGIPDNILNKPSKLTEKEYKIIQSHTIIGAKLLSEIDFLSKNISLGALEHHEKLDGSGYPYNKKNNDISLFGKILAVADIYDALTAKRVYKEPWPKEQVIKMLKNDCPKKFDCVIIEALEKCVID
ncbi:HDIG domain-containing protein [Marinitoga hydrogenitolerans DSM 16785]|uniref:HDIG domain-containing protein n=1 Tax=Marinitoga hydrogenitolerans (strain DSM 16785 / JCM 12826 / AT1271) TaxID=1122195 RepID=A0A1M4U4W1_MARH1|nr:HD-GYP domain-containing protein [Marinitoga hydrogenitolerans]SHE51666.1 HDIG domain-containing protein [Marinitoga hydrogenitolerans DSM 16785]